MSQSIIRYRTKPDQADANAELVRAVYAELHHTRPDGFRYATLRLDDQVTFLHIVQSEHDPSPILAVKAFGEFQADIAADPATNTIYVTSEFSLKTWVISGSWPFALTRKCT